MTTSAEAGFTKTVWLFLLHQGGRWKPSELSKEDIGYNGRALSSDLRNLAKAMPVNSFAVCRHGNAACVRPEHVVSISRSKAQIGKPMPPHQRAAIAMACQGIRKLKAEDVQEIRASDEPRDVLAARKKISETYVQQIRSGQVWRDFSNPFAGLGARAQGSAP